MDTNVNDVYRDMNERDDIDGFGPEYDAEEKAQLEAGPDAEHEAERDEDGLTKDDWARAEAEHDALMNAVPDHDEEAAWAADDMRREEAHEKAVENGEFKPWEAAKEALSTEKPWFMRNEAETARSAEHEHDHDR